MNHLNILLTTTVLLITLPVDAQERNKQGKGRRNDVVRGILNVEVVTVPEDMAAIFEQLEPSALLYQPVNKKSDKIPLIISLQGFGGGNRSIENKKWMGEAKRLLKPEDNPYETMLPVPQTGRG